MTIENPFTSDFVEPVLYSALMLQKESATSFLRKNYKTLSQETLEHSLMIAVTKNWTELLKIALRCLEKRELVLSPELIEHLLHQALNLGNRSMLFETLLKTKKSSISPEMTLTLMNKALLKDYAWEFQMLLTYKSAHISPKMAKALLYNTIHLRDMEHLMFTPKLKYLEITKHLLQLKGSSLSLKTLEKIMIFANRTADTKVIICLLEEMKEKIPMDFLEKLLLKAIRKGHTKLVRYLLEKKGVYLSTEKLGKAFFKARSRGYTATLQVLKENGYIIHPQPSTYFWSTLHFSFKKPQASPIKDQQPPIKDSTSQSMCFQTSSDKLLCSITSRDESMSKEAFTPSSPKTMKKTALL